MKELGYPLTWRTACFIGVGNVGCGATIFAHTNGAGDFVLFDALGDPWPIHRCYLDRAKFAKGHWTRNIEVEIPRPKKAWKSVSDIQRVSALSYSSDSLIHVAGYLQEHHPTKRDEWINKVGGLGAQVIWRALSKYPDQFTIVTGDPDAGLQSFTAFGDLKKIRVKKKDMVRASLRPVILMAVKDRPVVFVAESFSVLPW